MKRLKGPDLKMPHLRVPHFLGDLYYDLRERRLLPLVALVVVAIAAVPFLLGGDSEETPPSAAESPAVAGTSAAPTAELTVVKAEPGLRDYRKRLEGRSPTDPFEQRFSGPSGDGQLNDPVSSSPSASSASSEATATAPSSAAPEATPESSPPPVNDGDADPEGDSGGLRLFTFAVNVQISKSETKPNGRTVMGKPEIRRRVMPTTPLPGAKAPVVTYMGVDAEKGTKALLMVSNNVKSVFGDVKCLSGTDICQLLEVEPGFPTTFVYGANDVRYKINVLKIEAVGTGKYDPEQ
jgi:hypothetical protein